MQHLATTDEIAAGLRALPLCTRPFAAAQAAWRFYTNPRISLPQLMQPLIASARLACSSDCDQFLLAVHDWSGLNYSRHASKADRILLHHPKELGYELQTVLALSDSTGCPLAPIYQSLRAADHLHSSRSQQGLPLRSHLDELSLTLQYVEGLNLGKPLVHICDCEADSVLHLRRFNRKKFAFVVRADSVRRVLFEGRDVLLSEVLARLEDKFHFSRQVEFKGKPAKQYVAETEVTLHRYAKLHRRRGGKLLRRYIGGKPLKLRLVVSRVRDGEGNLMSQWLLWTNQAGVSDETIALWYYWRWRIESYFKLLKRAGQHIEQWQQQTAAAVAKRLLVTSQACVVVWELARSKEPRAKQAREMLVRLSGRLMKRNKEFTEPALLAGMWVMLAMLDALRRYSVEEIKQKAAFILPQLVRRDSG
jgi:hypothetical protein